MQRRIAVEEGIWIEPAGAASVAALAGLLERGEIQSVERIVCIMSGAGFKDARLAADEAQVIGQQQPAPFDAEAVAALLTQ